MANGRHVGRTYVRTDSRRGGTADVIATTGSAVPNQTFLESAAINGTGQTGRNGSYTSADRAALAELPGRSCWFARSDESGHDGTGQE